MAITQDRMLQLLEAGEDALQALVKARELLDTAIAEVENGKSAEGALETLGLMMRLDVLLDYPVATQTTLCVEREHFNPSRLGHNRRARERLRRIRRTE